jgi:pSer/pThr/pTyr-binding forkhead associated (FHA) protein/tetratricopeptide (TPR) repeat protein
MMSSNPRRSPGPELMEAPFPGRPSSTDEQDMGPTGEHASDLLELSGSDLEAVNGGLEAIETPILPEDGPTFQADAGPAGQIFDTAQERHEPASPFERTLPPSRGPIVPAMSRAVAPEDLERSAEEIEPLDEPMDNAPTRIEREEDIRASIDGEAPPSAGPRLLIIGGNNRGREFTLKPADNCIGRGTDNDVVLADIAVSRKHTMVCYEAGQFIVRDLGSGNGTLLNGKKVTSHPLQDGDQLELGNTLLRFLGAVVPPQLAHMSTVVKRADDIPGSAIPTLDVPRQHLATVAARPAAGFSPRARKLLIFGGVALILLFGGMLVLKSVMSSRKQQQLAAAKAAGPKPDEILMQEFNEGIKQYNARNWEQARVHFQKVLALAPNQGSIRHYVEVTASEQAARDALEKARSQLAGRDHVGARVSLGKIATSSIYSTEAKTLAQKIDDDQVTRLIEQARTLQADGNPDTALERIKEAQKIAPTNPAVRDLYTELTSGSGRKPIKKGEPVVRVEPKTKSKKTKPEPKTKTKVAIHRPEPKTKPEPPDKGTPIKVGGNQAKAAVALYKKKQFGPAYQAIKDFAATQKGKKQKQAAALAETIRVVGQAWGRAEKMEGSNPAQAMKYYQDAAQGDLKIEKGPHQKYLKERLFKVARAQAYGALQRNQNGAAYAAVKVAEKYGKRDASLQKVIDTLQKRAQELFDKAYTMRSNRNVAGARRLWQEILRMVPPSSPVYQKAYGWLNSSTPGHQDEDEE